MQEPMIIINHIQEALESLKSNNLNLCSLLKPRCNADIMSKIF